MNNQNQYSFVFGLFSTFFFSGKSPVCISEHINPNEMAVITDRIVWGKLYNGGQTCVAPNHIVCHTTHISGIFVI